MLLSVLTTVCVMAVGDKPVECDVRVKYYHSATSVNECALGALAVANVLHNTAIDEGLKVLISKGECYDLAGIKDQLNALPRAMQAINADYSLTFY